MTIKDLEALNALEQSASMEDISVDDDSSSTNSTTLADEAVAAAATMTYTMKDMAREVFDSIVVQDHEVDVPVHRAEGSVPTAEEIRNNSQQRHYKIGGMRWLKLGIAVIVALSVLLGISIGLSRNYSYSNNSRNPGRRSGYSQVVKYLSDFGVSDEAALQDPSTPQYKAAKWLAEKDGRNLKVPKKATLETLEGYKYMTRYVMALLFYTTGERKWFYSVNYLADTDICDWHGFSMVDNDVKKTGVSCQAGSNLPISLNLGANNLTRTLPTELGLMTTLQRLDMENNELSGSIPSELCGLTNLRSLYLSWNKLSQLPTCLGNLEDLEYLHLNNNILDDELPASTAKLVQLKQFFVNDNMLTGEATAIFNKLKNLELLMAHNNNFDGIIDKEFLKHHEKLEWADFSGNAFVTHDSGLPSHLLQMQSLQVLDLSNNRLLGPLPEDLSTKDTPLEYLSLYDNSLKSTIPAALHNLKNLKFLDLSKNLFTGGIPHALGNLKHLRSLFLGDNPSLRKGNVPPSYANLTKLEELSLRDSKRTGKLPPFLGEMSKLVVLDMSVNDFHDDIPGSYGSNWPHLEFLMLNDNPRVSSSLPNGMATLPKLRAVFLDNTNITGNVEETICQNQKFKDGNIHNDVAYADCESFGCKCCVCCAELAPGKRGCSIPFQKQLRKSWTKSFHALNFELHNDTVILNRDYIPPKPTNQ